MGVEPCRRPRRYPRAVAGIGSIVVGLRPVAEVVGVTVLDGSGHPWCAVVGGAAGPACPPDPCGRRRAGIVSTPGRSPLRRGACVRSVRCRLYTPGDVTIFRASFLVITERRSHTTRVPAEGRPHRAALVAVDLVPLRDRPRGHTMAHTRSARSIVVMTHTHYTRTVNNSETAPLGPSSVSSRPAVRARWSR